MREADYDLMAERRRRAHADLSSNGFRHRKGGGDYTALGVAMNSDTLALEVVYVSHATEDWWTRSLEEFLDGRFRYLMLAPRTAAELGLTAIAESWTARALDPATRALVAGSCRPAQDSRRNGKGWQSSFR